MRNIYVSGCHCFLSTPTRALNLDEMITRTYSFFSVFDWISKNIICRDFTHFWVRIQKYDVIYIMTARLIHQLLYSFWISSQLIDTPKFRRMWGLHFKAHNFNRNSEKLTTKCIPQIIIVTKSQYSRVMT